MATQHFTSALKRILLKAQENQEAFISENPALNFST
jgi:hypothetical protein